MAIKIIDDSKVKVKNKDNDKEVEEAIKKLKEKDVTHVRIIRNSSGDIVLLETHYKK
jgi:hypothetical protein|tara:strand:+ start:857 stop:1027 length:171 start_codon:yes stop_codon:yes gene_type:complete